MATALKGQYTEYPDETGRIVCLHVEKMWEVTAANLIYRVPLRKLVHFLNVDYWDDSEHNAVTPMYVITAQWDKRCKHHRRAIINCDLRYPLIVRGSEGRLRVKEVLDGVHRLTAMYLLGKRWVNVVFITDDQQKQCETKLPNSYAQAETQRNERMPNRNE